mmetsp:Transcript_27371/g.48396  ORF Transcript_27371/g.48396 Transcript_27371/m.48396 type:complete len:304 (+) Transcript_27371:101-1012(+)|eukprot:CAMPEP_0197526516 /NCGR_PEP_ID=MMETSP1318-20131121/18020_1 /TAXON_ID=552666 /ORGANISM="Partenskyella glossopodia, Strain RCC365" /LENGTH=303 /DNA_ID=CAMNT_0043080699 /DNA_START=30 /DNA_END=941 /DNA_ORIENTATION=+
MGDSEGDSVMSSYRVILAEVIKTRIQESEMSADSWVTDHVANGNINQYVKKSKMLDAIYKLTGNKFALTKLGQENLFDTLQEAKHTRDTECPKDSANPAHLLEWLKSYQKISAYDQHHFFVEFKDVKAKKSFFKLGGLSTSVDDFEYIEVPAIRILSDSISLGRKRSLADSIKQEMSSDGESVSYSVIGRRLDAALKERFCSLSYESAQQLAHLFDPDQDGMVDVRSVVDVLKDPYEVEVRYKCVRVAPAASEIHKARSKAFQDIEDAVKRIEALQSSPLEVLSRYVLVAASIFMLCNALVVE